MTTTTPKEPAKYIPGKLAYTVNEIVATGLFSRSGLYRALETGAIVAHKSLGRTVILATELERYQRALPEAEIGQGKAA